MTNARHNHHRIGRRMVLALPTAQGIIMRDGGICDPIRWGC